MGVKQDSCKGPALLVVDSAILDSSERFRGEVRVLAKIASDGYMQSEAKDMLK